MARPKGTNDWFAGHKPDCACNPCRSRRGEPQVHAKRPLARPKEAIVVAGRDGRGRATTPRREAVLDALRADPFVVEKVTSRSRIAAWIAMRAEDPSLSTAEISRRLGLAPKTLAAIISLATKEGWLKFDDPLERLEHEIIPKTLDNMQELLNDGDKQMTIEVAKGTLFPQFREAKGVSDAPRTVLALKIEAYDPTTVKVMTGQIVGSGRTLGILADPDPSKES